MTERLCDLCDRPTSTYICGACGDRLARDLRDLADWLDDELETTITGTKAVRARPYSGGAGTASPSLRLDWRAADLRAQLRRTLAETVRHCDRSQTPHTSPYVGGPDRDRVQSMAGWLVWRVDGLCLDPAGVRYADPIIRDTAQARATVDTRPRRQYLGDCPDCGRGALFAAADDAWARCSACGVGYPADEMRAYLLAELEDRLMTAAEIAQLSTHLGLRLDRHAVRKRVNQWHTRGRLTPTLGPDAEPRFRFGDVWSLLAVEDSL